LFKTFQNNKSLITDILSDHQETDASYQYIIMIILNIKLN